LHAIVQVELAFMHWELFVSPELCFVLFSFADGVKLVCLPSRRRHFKHFVSIVLSRCPCLRGPRFSHSSDLCFGFCLASDHFLGFFVRLFNFFFHF
jgi:hypothetical protein